MSAARKGLYNCRVEALKQFVNRKNIQTIVETARHHDKNVCTQKQPEAS